LPRRLEGALRLVPPLVLGASIYILLLPLSTSYGLPSYERGVFHSATIGYYLEAANLLALDGWWTGKACLGFMDLLRFYPPISILILYAVKAWQGSPALATTIGMTLAVSLAVAGLFLYTREITNRPLAAALAAPLAVLAVPGYAGAIAVYWEYTRIMGDGLALASLAFLEKGLRAADEKSMILAAALYALTILTSLISAQWAAVVWLVTLTRELVIYYRADLGESVAEILRQTWRGVLTITALAGWWIVPAIVPWGLAHYARIQTPLRDKLAILQASLTLEPNLGLPIIGLVAVIAALTGLAGARRDPRVPWLYTAALAVLAYSLWYGQGTRLFPIVGLLLAAAGLAGARYAGRHLLVVVLVVLAAGALTVYPVYQEKFHLDHTYLETDEYKVAAWLAANPPGGHVYLMYGPRFHGNQWVQVFNPNVSQVLSHYMEGCLNPASFEIDWYIKETLNPQKTHQLLVENNVTIIVVDREWRQSQLTVVDLMLQEGTLTPAPINPYLDYSEAYYVVDATPGTPTVVADYWTPARILGVATSLAAAVILARRRGGR